MIRRQAVSEVFRNLYAAKQRSLLALIGIVIGTGSVIAMINVGTIVQAEALRQFLAMGTDLMSVSLSGGGQRRGESELPMSVVERMPTELPAVTMAAPIYMGGGQASFRGRAAGGSMIGSTAALGDLVKMRAREGRLLSDFDNYEAFCVIGSGMAARLGANGPAPVAGDELRIGTYLFRIVGILEEQSFNPLVPFDVNSSIFLSPQNVKRSGGQARLNTILLRRDESIPLAEGTEAVQAYLAPHMRGAPVQVRSAEQLIATMNGQMQLYTLLLGAIGSISLIVGGVGVMNVMLVSVTERRREIGIRMAIGARRGNIRTMFFLESLILSMVGGTLGTAMGVGASAVFANFSGWQFALSPVAIPLGAGVSAAVGIFFGFYPAVQASRLDPIEALRSE